MAEMYIDVRAGMDFHEAKNRYYSRQPSASDLLNRKNLIYSVVPSESAQAVTSLPLSSSVKWLTLESVLRGNAVKKLFFKNEGERWRFALPLMKFCSSYLQEASFLHRLGFCLALKGKFAENIVFQLNMFDRVRFANPPKRLQLNEEKDDDYKNLGVFLASLLKKYNCPGSTEIENFISLLKAPSQKLLILNHYCLWGSSKRIAYFEKLNHLYELPHVEEDPDNTGHIDINNLERKFFYMVKDEFESSENMSKCIEDKNFWEVCNEDIVMKDNYEYYERKQSRIDCERKEKSRAIQAAAMEAAAMRKGASKGKYLKKRTLPQAPSKNKKMRSSGYMSYQNNVGGLLRFMRNVFAHYRIDSQGKPYTFVDLEWRFYLYFPDFLHVICQILRVLKLYPRLS